MFYYILLLCARSAEIRLMWPVQVRNQNNFDENKISMNIHVSGNTLTIDEANRACTLLKWSHKENVLEYQLDRVTWTFYSLTVKFGGEVKRTKTNWSLFSDLPSLYLFTSIIAHSRFKFINFQLRSWYTKLIARKNSTQGS